ncbi:Imm63 family immunity protein [Cellulomonas bogoriensis]|uniref:Imm63 family immunity protein n=1 Tax=Cellulomonas bogoriensis TaxID=301388 RepID=UPI000AEA4648|nr:Imm63 family immunity protein [Cellulomonas bogoriensis]
MTSAARTLKLDGPSRLTYLRAHLTRQISRLATEFGLEGDDGVPSFSADGESAPAVRVDASGRMHYVARERGRTIFDRTTHDPQELLYWCAKGMAYHAAWSVPVAPESAQDRRALIFATQARLLHRLNPQWAIRWRSEMLAKDWMAHDLAALLPDLPPPDGGR